MGLDLVLRGEGRELNVRFSQTDWDTIAHIRSLLPDAISTLSDTPEIGSEVQVSVDQLRAAVEAIDHLLAELPELLPYTYQFKCEYLTVGEKQIPYSGWGSGGMSGIRLPGDAEHVFVLWGGLNHLQLTKMTIGSDGRGRDVGVRDLRGEDSFQTLTCGLIRFRKKRAKTALRKGLARIREFLVSMDGLNVVKLIC